MGDPSRYHIEDVGRILLHAQRELSQIRAGLDGGIGAADPRMAKHAMSEALSRAEANLRLKAEAVLSSSAGQTVAALPSLKEYNFRTSSAGDAAMRSLIDAGSRARPPPRPRSAERRGHRAPLPAPTVKAEQAARVASRALDDPTSALGRKILAEQYGVAPPRQVLGRGSASGRQPTGRLLHDKTSKPAGVVEKEARTNPQAAPPPIRPEDVSKGLLSLINRGLLPSHADLTPALSRAPAPAMQAPSRIHPAEMRHDKHSGPAYTSPFGFSAANLKLDLLTGVGESLAARQEREAAEEAEAIAKGQLATAMVAVVSPGDDLDEAAAAAADAGVVSVEKARGFNELMDTFSLHHFIIRRGEVLSDTPEFVSYQRKHAQHWGALADTIALLRALLGEYGVPLAYVDGKKLADLALDALSQRTEAELLGCLVNGEQVAAHMRRPGARFLGDRALASRNAALRLQAEWRRMIVAREYRELRRRHAASRVIARWWRFFCDRTATRVALAERRTAEQAAWEGMTARFWREWPRIRRGKRVVIHIPSLSYAERQRRTLANLDVRQNAQMARLCEIREPDVEVIYVAPFPLNDDTVSYFQKVLEIGGAAEPAKRFRIVVPENYHRFPAHCSLATLLLYSPRALRRIANLVRAKDAYIVPNVVGPDELRLSMRLGVPLLSAEPRVAAIYSTKSGSKRIFQAAHVNVPPGAHDLYDQDDLVGSLAHLIAHNLDVPKWLFKVDDEFGGRGNAHLLTSQLPCYAALLAQYNGDPIGWAEESVQAGVQERIANELERLLPTAAVIGCSWLFQSWEEFMAAFSRSGGVIEASPLEVRSTPSVSLFIEPDGHVQLLCTHEQILRDYSFVGAAFPQTAVPHPALRDAALAIGRACYAKSIIGHVGVDLIAFVDDQRLLRVWAVDLNLRLTHSAAIFRFFDFLVGGEYDVQSGMYYAPPTASAGALEPGAAPRSESERRSYVSNELLYHPDFAHVHHSAFFNMCRLKGISFDLQTKSGTIFNLVDSFASCLIGVLAVGRTQLDALKTFTDCLDFIQRDVGSTVEIEPESNGYVEVGIKDIVTALKGLVDRSKKHTRVASKDGRHSRSAKTVSSAGATETGGGHQSLRRQGQPPGTPSAAAPTEGTGSAGAKPER